MAAYADVAAISVRGQFPASRAGTGLGMLPDQDALHAAMAEARVGPLLEQAVAQAADETLTDYAPALKTLECERGACWPIGWTWRRGACRSPSRRSRRTSNGSAAR